MVNSDFLERAQWRGEAAKEAQQQMEQLLQTSSFAQTPQQVTATQCSEASLAVILNSFMTICGEAGSWVRCGFRVALLPLSLVHWHLT